jgi:hypothetical protein
MAMTKSNVACVHKQNISQYDSGERCGPWASCIEVLYIIKESIYELGRKQDQERRIIYDNPCGCV